MQKFNDPCIKTGDFARLCGTNKRTLIHYDEIGLFKPAYTDDRGYRYYSESQFDVFFTINCLSKLGMPLKEIGAFLNHRNPQALKKLLLEQREEVLKEEERIRKTRQVIETKLALVSLQEKLESNQAGSSTEHIFQEYTPEEYMILSDPLNTRMHPGGHHPPPRQPHRLLQQKQPECRPSLWRHAGCLGTAPGASGYLCIFFHQSH